MTKPTGREFRVTVDAWPDEAIELRAEGDGMTFSGYAAVFDSWSEDLGGFRERIRPGAFDKTLTEKRAIKMFWNHNSDIALGSTRTNLALTTDKRGLLATAKLPDTTAGRDMAELVRSGIVDSMSFGFQAIKEAWDDNGTKRELVEARLFEVSPVTGWPAYPATSASVRELAEQIDAPPDAIAEAFAVLRDLNAMLTNEQHALLVGLINARHKSPVVSQAIAERLAKLAARGFRVPEITRRAPTKMDDADREFLTGMIAHHQAAIDMAREYLAATSPDTRLAIVADLARNIIEAQTAEIADMRSWLAAPAAPMSM